MTANKVLFIMLCICLIGLLFGLYKLTLAEYIKKRVHEFDIPESLANNTEYLLLIEDCKALIKLNSWTSEHKKAEDNYKFRFKSFLRTDWDKSKLIDIPLIAIRLQTSKILIENHYDAVGNLDWRKAITERGHTLGVNISYLRDSYEDGADKEEFPEDIDKALRLIEEAYDLLDEVGQDVAKEEIYRVEDQIKAMTR